MRPDQQSVGSQPGPTPRNTQLSTKKLTFRPLFSPIASMLPAGRYLRCSIELAAAAPLWQWQERLRLYQVSENWIIRHRLASRNQALK
jgi:hypothetical protein